MGSFRTSTGRSHTMRLERAQRHWPCQVGSSSNPEKLSPKLPLLPAPLLTCKRMCKTFRGTLHSFPSGFTGSLFSPKLGFLSFTPLSSLLTSPGEPFTDPLGGNSLILVSTASTVRTLLLKV